MKFFITGATGFIGTHLTKALIERGETVTALINRSAAPNCFEQATENFSTAKIDLLNTKELTNALQGQDIVVHLAYSNQGSPAQQHRIIVGGTQSILRAAIAANVKRFIHMSTASVYGEPPKDKLYTETEPRYASLGLYTSLKQEAELFVLNEQHLGTEVVVLQPSIIYGPGPGYWTDGILKALYKGTFPLINGGSGLCNLIHVYDVVDAIVLAATVPNVDTECFILANDRPVTWKTFFKAYEDILGKKCLFNLPVKVMKNYNVWKQYQRKSIEYKLYAKVLKVLINILQRQDVRKQIKFPSNERIDFFAAKPHFSNQKARNILRFSPKITIEEGMSTVSEWVRENHSYG